MEGLEQREDLTETTPPPGALKASLYSYQRKALTWMIKREESRAIVQGGILADEQGLGKTVQMLALIVSNVPDKENALRALKNCKRDENVVQYHPLGQSSRDRRAEAEAGRSTIETL